MRRLLKKRLGEEYRKGDPEVSKMLLLEQLQQGPMATDQDAANCQHYEVPAAFYRLLLGPRLKYSSAYWPEGVTDLATAEEAMLTLTCQRAQVEDGQSLLDLGCGWGSLSLWMAANYPRCHVTALSNSVSQKAYIDRCAAKLGLSNLRVLTGDVATFDVTMHFDRILSVEMFEHLRNHRLLMEKIAHWLAVDGKLFVHHFCHKDLFYRFEDEQKDDWMARHFFTGGVMPSFDLLERCQSSLVQEAVWSVNGSHYSRTLESWLCQLDTHCDKAIAILDKTYGKGEQLIWLQRWRMFLMASAELFNYRNGEEWYVGHYRFTRSTG